MDLKAFFEMGGYALYVWTAYGLAAVVLVWNLISAFRRSKHVLNKVIRLSRPEGRSR